MADPFIGEISMFGGNFAPRGWALCDGQLLAISSNTPEEHAASLQKYPPVPTGSSDPYKPPY